MMNKLAIAAFGILCTGAIVLAQAPTRLYTRPTLPAPEILERLNLKQAWRSYLPTDGRRDGVFSVQIPERLQPAGGLLLVQMRSAIVMALDSASGATLWRTRIGTPYAMRQPLGYNSRHVFVANGVELYALSRQNGQIDWVLTMPHVASSAPAAD